MLDPAQQSELLLRGDVVVEGRVAGSSNQALLVSITLDGEQALACYKAEAGERPLWDFPDGLWRREVAAYQLDQLLGISAVPVTVAREDLPFGRGSLQWWIEGATDDHYFTLRERAELYEWFWAVSIFDVVANNADRKAGHVLFDGTRCWAIDNGLCFHTEDKLRTVIWEYAELTLPPQLREPLESVARGETGHLSYLLDGEEILAMRERARALVNEGVSPAPDDERDWPPYPWPLI